MADNLLVQSVINGKVENTATKTTNEEKETRGTSNLGKDAFLQLLVAEMQNQDPLEPSTNTEWISQLATFSQLEELQSLTSSTEKSQMLSLVGKQVIVTVDSANGGKITKSGRVDYVTNTGADTKFSVDGSLYSMDNLKSVVGDDYHYEQNRPSLVKKDAKYTFYSDDPQDVQFEVNMGSDVAEATDVALTVGNTVLPSDYVIVSGKTVTIKSELLKELSSGTYPIDVVFDDKNFTTVKNGLTITVFSSKPEETANDSASAPEISTTPTESQDHVENGNAAETENNSGTVNNENLPAHNMKQGDLADFDYDAVRALYPELTDEEFAYQFGNLFIPAEEDEEEP